MKQNIPRLVALGLLLIVTMIVPGLSAGQRQSSLAGCREIGFSTEEDFLTRGPTPPDGNPIVSDGDLLGRNGHICARNRDLVLEAFDVVEDMGLDAADVISLEQELVVFSTELDSPHGNFKAGDLLTNHGAAVPNQALLAAFGQVPDMGLDALHFTGVTDDILRFLAFARQQGRDYWLRNPQAFRGYLQEYSIDLWFSIEGTLDRPGATMILDGDLLSAATGTVVFGNGHWLAAPIPAGLPDRGVDFGLDGFGADCRGKRETARFSTEILYRDKDSALTFTDGSVLDYGGGVVETNWNLIASFEPATRMMGLDALTYPLWREECVETRESDYLPMIMRLFQREP
jgi:hypothetical protein